MAKRRGPQPNSKSARRAAGAMVDVPSRRVAIAQQCWASGQHSDALSLFDEAIRQEPKNVRAYVMAARAYAEKFNFERMEQTLDKLIRRAPRHPGVHHYVGEIFNSLKLPDRAIASFQTAARLPGAGPPTWLELASLFERGHRLEEAEALIERHRKSKVTTCRRSTWSVGAFNAGKKRPKSPKQRFAHLSLDLQRTRIGRARRGANWP